MGRMPRLLMSICAGAILAGSAHAAAAADAGHLSILTYNVHGLPWPLASNRPAAMIAIAAQLRIMRLEHRQPDVVALQEAFGDEAKKIGRAAGYRYMAVGPGIADRSTIATSAADRKFLAAGSYLSGEGVGKRVDSGLAIFSDHPILAVRRIVYPVCAGYDCLANKGALAATILAPGGRKVTVLDTHLNSGRSSGVSKPRRRYAHGRQLAQVSAFAAAIEAAGEPLLLAGDFNVGHDPVRLRNFSNLFGSKQGSLKVASTACRNDPSCRFVQTPSLVESLLRAKDWLLYRASAKVGIRPTAITAPFGRDRNGAMLSDHIGLVARYLIEPLGVVKNRIARRSTLPTTHARALRAA